uniref:SAS-6_N domain-containing protein n=1 Tax=Macrostomum lignano TaxID=282301 RepID=A0A1I8IGQ3_9PLAT
PRYILQLSPGPDHWCLNVVETNPFKHLTHLSLRFLAGSDADVRDYLAACLKKLRTDSGQAAKAASATEADLRSRLERCQEQLAGRSAELERLRTDVETRSQEAAAKAAAELAYERQKAHLRIVKQLETQNSELTASCKSLQEENFRLELQLKEATARATRLEESESQLRRELDAAKHDRDGLGRTRQEQEAAVHQLTTRVAVLEQELKDKDALLARTGDLLETEKAARKRLEDDLAARQRRVEGLERKQSATVSEMEKGNEVIKKLQAELRQLLKKLESRSQLAVKQEKAVTRLEEELTAAREQARSAERQAQQKVDEIADLKDQISSLQKKLEESKQLLRSNDNVIQWLNKQINESQARSAAPGAGMGAKKFDHAVPAALQSYRPAVPLTSSAASAAATASAATAAAPPIGLDSKYLHRTAAGSGLANGGSRIPPPHPPGTSAAPGAPATSGQMSLTSAYFPGAVK